MIAAGVRDWQRRGGERVAAIVDVAGVTIDRRRDGVLDFDGA